MSAPLAVLSPFLLSMTLALFSAVLFTARLLLYSLSIFPGAPQVLGFFLGSIWTFLDFTFFFEDLNDLLED